MSCMVKTGLGNVGLGLNSVPYRKSLWGVEVNLNLTALQKQNIAYKRHSSDKSSFDPAHKIVFICLYGIYKLSSREEEMVYYTLGG